MYGIATTVVRGICMQYTSTSSRYDVFATRENQCVRFVRLLSIYAETLLDSHPLFQASFVKLINIWFRPADV